MGNGLGCGCYRDICSQEIKNDTFIKVENDPIKTTNLYEMAKYFEDVEKEIHIKNDKKKLKKIISFKKFKNTNSLYNTVSKYELMLKRLLEQKNIERKGPKRRKTLRKNNNDNFIKLIQKVIENEKNKIINENKKIEENKNIDTKGPKRRETIRINNNKNFIKLIKQTISDNKHIDKNKEKNLHKKGSILLNYKEKLNSTSLQNGKHTLIIKKFSKKKLYDGFGDMILDNEIKKTCRNTLDNKNNEE